MFTGIIETLGKIEKIEKDKDNINFSFSSSITNELKIDQSRVNVNGGAIALGHPIGASGSILIVKLLHEMQRRNAKRGLVSLCVGGGQGIAMVIENPNA